MVKIKHFGCATYYAGKFKYVCGCYNAFHIPYASAEHALMIIVSVHILK